MEFRNEKLPRQTRYFFGEVGWSMLVNLHWTSNNPSFVRVMISSVENELTGRANLDWRSLVPDPRLQYFFFNAPVCDLCK